MIVHYLRKIREREREREKERSQREMGNNIGKRKSEKEREREGEEERETKKEREMGRRGERERERKKKKRRERKREREREGGSRKISRKTTANIERKMFVSLVTLRHMAYNQAKSSHEFVSCITPYLEPVTTVSLLCASDNAKEKQNTNIQTVKVDIH